MQTYLQQKIPPATFSRSVPDNCAMVKCWDSRRKENLKSLELLVIQKRITVISRVEILPLWG